MLRGLSLSLGKFYFAHGYSSALAGFGYGARRQTQNPPHHSLPPWQGKHCDSAMRQPVNGRPRGGAGGKAKTRQGKHCDSAMRQPVNGRPRGGAGGKAKTRQGKHCDSAMRQPVNGRPRGGAGGKAKTRQGKHGDLAMRQPVNGRSCGGRSGEARTRRTAGGVCVQDNLSRTTAYSLFTSSCVKPASCE